jgi:hypothetical protein
MAGKPRGHEVFVTHIHIYMFVYMPARTRWHICFNDGRYSVEIDVKEGLAADDAANLYVKTKHIAQTCTYAYSKDISNNLCHIYLGTHMH